MPNMFAVEPAEGGEVLEAGEVEAEGPPTTGLCPCEGARSYTGESAVISLSTNEGDGEGVDAPDVFTLRYFVLDSDPEREREPDPVGVDALLVWLLSIPPPTLVNIPFVVDGGKPSLAVRPKPPAPTAPVTSAVVVVVVDVPAEACASPRRLWCERDVPCLCVDASLFVRLFVGPLPLLLLLV